MEISTSMQQDTLQLPVNPSSSFAKQAFGNLRRQQAFQLASVRCHLAGTVITHTDCHHKKQESKTTLSVHVATAMQRWTAVSQTGNNKVPVMALLSFIGCT